MINGYAATEPKGTLKPFAFDLGPLGDTQLRSKSSIAGYVTAISVCWTTNGDEPRLALVPGHEVIGTVTAALTGTPGVSRLGNAAFSRMVCRLRSDLRMV